MLLASQSRLHVRKHVLDRVRCLCMRSPTSQLREDCISLMRATAQSVSVVTARHPSTSSPPEQPYHGATLSSFTTVSMHPYPIVAFSLRKPSRMANLLHSTADAMKTKPNMVINLLSASQACTAVQFSRPHIYRYPFTSMPYVTTREGIPVLGGCLGALSCALVASWPLDDSTDLFSEGVRKVAPPSTEEQGSELFLARVLRVEDEVHAESCRAEDGQLPLLYFHRQYVTIDAGKPLIPTREVNGSTS